MMRNFRRFTGAFLIAAMGSVAHANTFSDSEAQDVMRYWAEQAAYTTSLPKDAVKNGMWQVRLTVEGSTWLWNYNRARGISKTNPGTTPGAQTPEQQEWEKWIDAKVAFDRYQAQLAANKLNSQINPAMTLAPVPELEHPGPAPEGMVKLAGNPPPFANVVCPLEHAIRFHDDTEIRYIDNPNMRPRFAYYRFGHGVQAFGKRVREMPEKDLSALFRQAGLNDSERKIMGAVSMLEGGFESVNTYDTGFVSVGLIQFASLREGGGSLGRVLRRMKRDTPEDFESAFRRFGLDADDKGLLVAIDPATGAELVGPLANQKIIDDKRLIAVFQRAGTYSTSFRLSQIRTARDEYLPADDLVPITIGGQNISLKIRDFIRSEAGMATLMDRKVNTGTLDPLPLVLAFIGQENGLRTGADFARYERDIVVAMKFRKDYLADETLTQPGPPVKPGRDYLKASRSGQGSSRGGRSKP